MVEEKEENAKDELKTIFDEVNDRYKNIKSTGFSTYTQDQQVLSQLPHDQFGHAYTLINNRSRKMEKEGFDIIADPQILLGNIKDEKSLKFYQMDVMLLTNLLACALNDPVMKVVFDPLWTVFKQEIRSTCNIDGVERSYQAFHVPMGQASRKGFGLFNKKKKQKEPIDYVIPSEDDEGIYG